MPTSYPKCSPTEMMGLLVLLNDHHGEEDIARLADDLDLEIDEILPAIEFAEILGFLSVSDGRAALTDTGRKLLAGTIRERKTLLREQLKKTTLFRALVRALESAPEHRLTDEEVVRLIEFTSAPADELIQNIINWGRYAELFRYDSDQRVLLPARSRSTSRGAGSSSRPPPSSGMGSAEAPGVGSREAPAGDASDRLSTIGHAAP